MKKKKNMGGRKAYITQQCTLINVESEKKDNDKPCIPTGHQACWGDEDISEYMHLRFFF